MVPFCCVLSACHLVTATAVIIVQRIWLFGNGHSPAFCDSCAVEQLLGNSAGHLLDLSLSLFIIVICCLSRHRHTTETFASLRQTSSTRTPHVRRQTHLSVLLCCSRPPCGWCSHRAERNAPLCYGIRSRKRGRRDDVYGKTSSSSAVRCPSSSSTVVLRLVS